MGVRGLTTYIANHHKKYLKSFKLHGCYVIIDGNSLACQIFVRSCSRAHCAFGGDYDRYAHRVREFFILMTKCQIKAIVVFDGGYELRKVKTVISRMSERIAAIKHIKPCSQDSAIVFPLFLRIVFKQVLKEMNVPFVQCDFEADQEIAALANKYNCPVLSYDSDFYIYDVNYIPIPLMELEAVPINFEIGKSSDKYCINCKIYKVEFFLNSFGGLDKTMLPLLASLLGNDYVKVRVFRKFYTQLKVPKGKGNQLQRKIARVIEWLRNETFDSAVKKILGRMKQIKHRSVSRKIMNAVSAYTNINVTIESFLPPEFINEVQLKKPEEAKEVNCRIFHEGDRINTGYDMDVEMEEIEPDEIEGDSLLSESESGDDSFDEQNCHVHDESTDHMDVEGVDEAYVVKEACTIDFPKWLLNSIRRGNVESCVIDILSLRMYFALPQIENKFYRTSHFTSISLIKVICKLLVGNRFQEISFWTKNDNGKVHRFFLTLSETKKITDIDLIPSLTLDQKKLLLLECLCISKDICLESFPENWRLYICGIIFWIKNSTHPRVTDCHLISICMCMVALNLIDRKVGFFRKKLKFLKKYGKLQKKIIKRIELGYFEPRYDNCETNGENKVTSSNSKISAETTESQSISQILSSVDSDDCLAVYEEFYLCHQLDENLKVNKSLFSMHDIHVFAQFQSCLYHVMVLNSLLEFPFEQSRIASLYSGTFIYNTCIAFKKFKNCTKYLQSLLNYAPKIMNLINTMFTEIIKVAPVIVLESHEVKSNRRRKRKRAAANKQVDNEEMCNDDVERERCTNSEEAEGDAVGYYDENNTFSLLSSM